ncbi:hydroxymethylglutaryl-CoA lyase [Synergistaceae bacterium OttesenSCG-928-I11]|nr:hydroxymethylglutaryl-CoA lyase [Synergistaceae bacterium OttesenSCG-928-I11]
MTNLKLPERVTLCEVGPRDGLQNEKTILSTQQKIELIERMVDAGARVIEIGSFVHPKAVPAMADTADVARGIKKKDGVEYRALALNKKGIERAYEAGVTKAKLTVSASPTHSRQNSNASPEEIVASFRDCADYAREHGITMSGAIATAFGYYAEGVIGLDLITPIVDKYLEIGVEELSMSDSTGFANPKQVYEYMSYLLERYPQVRWTLHTHNTRGMAMANIFAAMQAGVTRFDSSFAGIGGCPFAPGASGNIATEDVVYMMREMGIETGYDLEKILDVAETVSDWLGHDADSALMKVERRKDRGGETCSSAEDSPSAAKKTATVERRDVESKTIRSIGYEPVAQILEVEFRNGEIYQYSPVPTLVYAEFLNAGSYGTYMEDAIRDAGYVEKKIK